MTRTWPQDTGPDDDDGDWTDDADVRRDDDSQDPVLSLHDTEEESGDEVGLTDLYRMDTLSAEQRGVALDPTGAAEATLD